MQPVNFKEMCRRRLNHCIDLMFGSKDKEYTRNNDKFHAFKSAGLMDNEAPERSLWGMWKKQIVSIHDIINDIDAGKPLPPYAHIAEKISDNINYSLLLEGLILERWMHEELERLDKLPDLYAGTPLD